MSHAHKNIDFLEEDNTNSDRDADLDGDDNNNKVAMDLDDQDETADSQLIGSSFQGNSTCESLPQQEDCILLFIKRILHFLLTLQSMFFMSEAAVSYVATNLCDLLEWAINNTQAC
ncbi:unnamed protein product [Didymodactylos carnosus]|uniref:Uncharacterized protein n=1 Tax=Didymodactylos carnosus TaxID=1234261 RepID=A0A8S2DLR6_9BILA|nr:unnamed protein product [Didymodactylos carnosus]CAF3704717.1 unnamed protein product [Didymodactylos carnosus]